VHGARATTRLPPGSQGILFLSRPPPPGGWSDIRTAPVLEQDELSCPSLDPAAAVGPDQLARFHHRQALLIDEPPVATDRSRVCGSNALAPVVSNLDVQRQELVPDFLGLRLLAVRLGLALPVPDLALNRDHARRLVPGQRGVPEIDVALPAPEDPRAVIVRNEVKVLVGPVVDDLRASRALEVTPPRARSVLSGRPRLQADRVDGRGDCQRVLRRVPVAATEEPSLRVDDPLTDAVQFVYQPGLLLLVGDVHPGLPHEDHAEVIAWNI